MEKTPSSPGMPRGLNDMSVISAID